MDKESFIKRHNELENGILKQNAMIQQALADLNVLIGAKSEIERLLSAYDKPIELNDLKDMLGAKSIEVV